ncbi:hypothetical protein ACIBQX_47045 [Nonomuraea sp. NPDC049714]|uniref:hypothetical protein n=1 Tax=Nonomuraea sp. NPDC049714 TaxID=3364357 RepID=UPI00378E123D
MAWRTGWTEAKADTTARMLTELARGLRELSGVDEVLDGGGKARYGDSYAATEVKELLVTLAKQATAEPGARRMS